MGFWGFSATLGRSPSKSMTGYFRLLLNLSSLSGHRLGFGGLGLTAAPGFAEPSTINPKPELLGF